MSVTQSCTKFVRETRLCSSRKYPYPTVEGIGSSGGEGGSEKKKKLQSLYGRNMEVPRGRGLFTNSLLGGVWIFSGTTHSHDTYSCDY